MFCSWFCRKEEEKNDLFLRDDPGGNRNHIIKDYPFDAIKSISFLYISANFYDSVCLTWVWSDVSLLLFGEICDEKWDGTKNWQRILIWRYISKANGNSRKIMRNDNAALRFCAVFDPLKILLKSATLCNDMCVTVLLLDIPYLY